MPNEVLKQKLSTQRLQEAESHHIDLVISHLTKIRKGLQVLRSQEKEAFEQWKEQNLKTLPPGEDVKNETTETEGKKEHHTNNPVIYLIMGLPTILEYQPGDHLQGKPIWKKVSSYIPKEHREEFKQSITEYIPTVLDTISDQPQAAYHTAKIHPEESFNAILMIFLKIFRSVLNERHYVRLKEQTEKKETYKEGVQALIKQSNDIYNRMIAIMQHEQRLNLNTYFNQNALMRDEE